MSSDADDGSDERGPNDRNGVRASYRHVGAQETVGANRAWWDGAAQEYLAEHGDFLGDDDFVWCPEGLREAQAGLLGAVSGRSVLEVGCGAAQCARWLAGRGARVVGLDLSRGMLEQGRLRGPRPRGPAGPAGATGVVALVQADARRLPFVADRFDLACSAFGALPFVADPQQVHREVARVLRPGGRWVFAVTHPIRWAFPDDPGEAGLTVRHSYFDRTPYVEQDRGGLLRYAEHHRTMGDRVREIVGAGLVLDDVLEPEWPDDQDHGWDGWSPLRGRLIPGTAIFVSHRP